MHDNPRLIDGFTHATVRHVSITLNPNPAAFSFAAAMATADVSGWDGPLDQVAAIQNCEGLTHVTTPWTDLSATS